MNIIVCIKQVPNTTSVEVDPETGVLKRDGAKSKMNPYDLFALEQAFLLKERYGGKVVVISMGPNQAQEVLYEALHMGADSGFLLSDRQFAGADCLATAYALSQCAKKIGNYDVIICGKQTTDGDTAQVGPEMAELLDIPHVSNVLSVDDCSDGFLFLKADLDHSVYTIRVKTPCLITMEKDVNTPRLPSYLRRKKYRDVLLTVWSMADLDDKNPGHYGLTGSPTQVERIFPPKPKENRSFYQGSGEEMAETLCAILKEKKMI